MTQNEQRTATPPLRFPEFRKDPPWPETPLNAVLFEHGEKNDGKSEVHSVSVHKGVVNQVEHLGRSFAAADRSNYNLAKPHDIIYTKSPTGDFPYGIIKQNRLPYNVIVSPLYGVFSPINRYLGYLLDAYFESPFRTNAYLAPIIQKGAKNTIQISNARFLSKGLYLPPSEAEHKKIAECLSTLDELIEAERRKLDALKDHKKGLMQQLFPREGETRPRLRFAEFRASSDWERGVVRNIATVLQGYGFPEKYQGNTSAEFPFYKVSDISRTLAAGRHLMDEAANYIDHETLEKLKAKPIPAGTTIFAKIGEALRLNRRALTTRPCLIDNNTAGVKAIEEKATDLFLYYLFSTISLEKHAGGVVPAVSKTAIEEIEILYPKRDEQARIATFLSSIDDLIAAQSEKLEVLRTHKRGLMQQLFPNPSEF